MKRGAASSRWGTGGDSGGLAWLWKGRVVSWLWWLGTEREREIGAALAGWKGRGASSLLEKEDAFAFLVSACSQGLHRRRLWRGGLLSAGRCYGCAGVLWGGEWSWQRLNEDRGETLGELILLPTRQLYSCS